MKSRIWLNAQPKRHFKGQMQRIRNEYILCAIYDWFQAAKMEPFRDAKIMQIVWEGYHQKAREYIVVKAWRESQFSISAIIIAFRSLSLVQLSLVNSQQLLACMMIEGLDFAFRMLYHPLLHPFSKTPFIHLLREQNLEERKNRNTFLLLSRVLLSQFTFGWQEKMEERRRRRTMTCLLHIRITTVAGPSTKNIQNTLSKNKRKYLKLHLT